MRTLVLIKKDNCGCSFQEEGEILVFCPHCKKSSDTHDIADYVKDNFLTWCYNCNEIMFCTHPNLVDKMTEGKKLKGCTKRISRSKAKTMIKENGFNFEDKLSKYYCYSIALLRLLELSTTHFDGMGSNGTNSDDSGESCVVDIMRFSDAPPGSNLNHCGTYLYYKAECSDCGKFYQSYIWGD